MKNRNYLLFSTLIGLSALCSVTSAHASTTLGPNLISNSSFETADTSGLPTGWAKGGYGTNTRSLTYPVTPAEDGSRAARVSISSYTSGDAKWYFAPVTVTLGQSYQFSDWYVSDVPTEIDAQLKMSDGTFAYLVLGHPAASGTYRQAVAAFKVPAGAVSLTVFHVINQVGTLTVDHYSLNRLSDSNLVSNGDFETAGSSGSPASWNRGSWGTNTRTFSYPATGVGSSRGARVSISSYTSGDAKWYFAPLSLPAGVYSYTDSYISDIPSLVVVQLHKSDGSYGYQTIAYDAPQGSFANQTVGFVVPRGVADVTLFHLIQGVGSLTIDNVSVEANTDMNGVFRNGGVTLTFDNGWLSQYQNAIPKMNQYGFKGTFYIITHELSDYGYTGFVSKAQIKDMYAMGMEISSHTQTHPDLTQLSYAEQQQEITGSRNDLFALSVGPINSFAYPFGSYNADSVQIVKDTGYTNARATITGYTTPDSDHYLLPRLLVLNTTTAAEMEGWIDEAVAEKSWLIIEFHQVDTSGTQYSVAPAIFNEVMDYLAQKGVSVVTMDQGVQALKP